MAATGSACPEKAEIAFRDALQGVFGRLDWLPAADGELHRFHVPGDRAGSCNGWYVLHSGAIAAGAFGSWKAAEVHRWCSREPIDQHEAELVRQRIEEARRQREAEQHQRQQQAAEFAHRWWSNARRADPGHPYLQTKQVRAHGLRQRGDQLLVPLYLDGVLANLQRIGADGGKRFLRGGRITGCYSPLGSIAPGSRLYVCEGWATGATLHEHTGQPVACAMNAGNLKPVALALRAKYGDQVDLVIAGDDDRQTPGNPGRAAAIATALVAGAMVTFPEWPDDAPPTLTDFNDLAIWRAAHGC
jgi:putative DNA primase/helicase